MVTPRLNRRHILAGLSGVSALAALPQLARADDVIDLKWTDLMPPGQPAIPPVLHGRFGVNHENLSSEQPESMGVRTEWNGEIVRLPGFIIPIDYVGTGVIAFILVPFVGACIHVPPPPANQLVFVTTNEPYESSGLFEAVNVTGLFDTASTTTQLADIAYALSADKVEPFRV